MNPLSRTQAAQPSPASSLPAHASKSIAASSLKNTHRSQAQSCAESFFPTPPLSVDPQPPPPAAPATQSHYKSVCPSRDPTPQSSRVGSLSRWLPHHSL